METIKALYTKLTDGALINRCADYAQWTIPAVFPKQLHSGVGNQTVEYDYQSMGAMLVNKLASKLAQTLFPTNTSFFKLQLVTPNGAEENEEVARVISKLELAACQLLFRNAEYARIVQAIRLLVVTGNALLIRTQGSLRVMSLHNYVVRRNAFGDVLDIVTKESLYARELAPEYAKVLNIDVVQDPERVLELYTKCCLVYSDTEGEPPHWLVQQEINGQLIGEESTYPFELCPYIPVVWGLSTGDNYGRGIVEEYAGDFIKMSELSAALTTYELESCNVRYVVDPASTLDLKAAQESQTGDFVSGSPNGVSALELGEFQKIQALSQELQAVFSRLAQAFMYTNNQRDAERVTAYEIQTNAMEAEEALGGVYSQLSHAMHLPLAYLLCNEVNPQFWAQYLRGQWQLNIITGMQALGRSAELQQWLLLTQSISLVVPTLQQISPRFNTEKIIDIFMLGHGLSQDGVMLTGRQLEEKMALYQAQQEATVRQLRQIQSTDDNNDIAASLGTV